MAKKYLFDQNPKGVPFGKQSKKQNSKQTFRTHFGNLVVKIQFSEHFPKGTPLQKSYFLIIFQNILFKIGAIPKMKKQILGVVVMSFVTLAFLIVVNDITTNSTTQPDHNTVNLYESSHTPDLANID